MVINLHREDKSTVNKLDKKTKTNNKLYNGCLFYPKPDIFSFHCHPKHY